MTVFIIIRKIQAKGWRFFLHPFAFIKYIAQIYTPKPKMD